jgi:hypothetical protein
VKLISSTYGRASQRFLLDEVRPQHVSYLPDTIELAVRRYGFLKHSDLSAAAEKGIKFEHGRLDVVDGNPIAIESIDVFSDGIICLCHSTDDADLVLNDFLKWGVESLNMRPPQTKIRRDYASWLVVDFEGGLEPLLAKYTELHQLIRESYERTYETKIDFELQRLAFSNDPLKGQYVNVGYSIDRRINAPYELNRFFCVAPLRTEDHLKLLQQIERTFAK